MRNTFGHEAEVNHLTRQTPNGPVETYVVLVTRNVVALALQTGLVDRRKQQVRGLPSEVVNGSIAQIKAAWRGAFMARGFLSDPGKASFLEIACPTEEAAMALCGVARRLGIQAKHRTLRSSERVTLKDPTPSNACSSSWAPPVRPANGRQALRRRGPRQANRLANFDDANMRRSAKAAAEACDKVRQALRFLEMTFQTTSNRPASFVSTMLMRRWNSWDVGRSTNHQGCHRGPYPSTSAARRENRKARRQSA